MDTRIRIIAEAITKDAENNLKRLADLEKDLQEETTKAGDATKKQETNLNSLNDTANKSNSTFANLGKTMLALFAVDKLIDYSKQLITLMGDTDKYRTALKNVSDTNAEYEKSITFLTTISSKYGQSVNDLTQSYTKFIASSKSSNLPLEERQRIYASIIKAGSALKLSNEDVDGSLRAISQMFSKSKVSAEELSQQLGERIPGSLGALAKGMKMSEKDLLKMVENGNVLAKDVLPILATEFEKMYGDKAQSNLKTIGGAWNVFVNNFIEGLQDFNKSSLFIETISSWILAAAESLKIFIGWIKDAFTIGNEYNKVLNKWYDYYEVVYDAIKKVVGAGWDLIKSLGQIVANIVGAGDATLTFKKIVDYMIIGIKTLGSVLIGAVTIIQALADGFNIALNYGMRLANFFGKDFKIDPKATFSNLAQNAETNFKRITDLWANSSSKVIGTAKTTNKAIIDESDKTTKELEKDLNQQGANDKKANDKKLNGEKELNKKLKAEKEAFQQKISDIDNRGEEERAFEREKYIKRIYPIYVSIYEKVQSAIDNLSKDTTQAGEAYSKSLTDRITKDSQKIEEIIKKSNEFYDEAKKNAKIDMEVEDLWDKTLKETEEQFANRQALFEAVFETSFDYITEVVNKFYDDLDKKTKEGETAAERQGAAINKAFLEPMKENVNAAKALISGDYLGAAKGLYGYFEGIWKVTIGFRDTLKEININEFNLTFNETMANLSSYSEQIKENFEGLADASVEFNQVQKTGTDALIQAEIDRAGKIRDNYDMAMSKEDELYNKRIKNINEEYALKDALANQRFDADSLLIQTNLNTGLLALLTNEESKTSIMSDYAGRRSTIMQQFALADSDITEKTTQAEKDAINAAIEARTKALAELESWYTTELEFTINSEGQKRKEYTATAQLIKDAVDAQNVLDNQFAADAIVRESNKQIALEAETQRHNDEQIRLEEVKNSALLNSFNALKDAMKAGYSEILAAANEAYTSGLITAQQYLDKLKEINALRGLVGEGTPTLNQDIRDRLRNLGIPGFKTGTEMVGGIKGVDKNLAWLSNDEAVLQGDLNKKRLDAGINRFQMVEYAINYKSILDGGFQPLQIKTSALDKLEEHKAMQYLLNMNADQIVSELQEVKNAIKKLPIHKSVFDKDGFNEYIETKSNVTKFLSKRTD